MVLDVFPFVSAKKLHLKTLQILQPMANSKVYSAPAREEVTPYQQATVVCLCHYKRETRRQKGFKMLVSLAS